MTTASTLLTSIKYDLKVANSSTSRDNELLDYMSRVIQDGIFPTLVRFQSDLGTTEWKSTETSVNVRSYALPSGFVAFQNLWLIEPDLTGTLAAGGTSTVTLASDASTSADVYNAKLFRTTGGTGDNQQTVITDYSAARVATLNPALSTAATTSTTYAVFPYPRTETDRLKQKALDYVNTDFTGVGRPSIYALDGSNLILGHIPDQTYVLWGKYFSRPSSVSTSGSSLPYNAIFDGIIRQYSTLMALNRDEYNIQVEASIFDRIDADVASMLVRRGERSTNLPLRGTRDI